MNDGAHVDDLQPLDELETAAWRGLLQAHRHVIDALEAELRAEADLPLGWFEVLLRLADSGRGALRMQELADAVLLSKSGLTRLVDRMEQAGLVTREACADDGRGVNAVLTDAGRQALDRARPVHLRGVRRYFADRLKPDEAEVLAEALDRVLHESVESGG
jgi:DNA-binding MarR family transcriptional regulator